MNEHEQKIRERAHAIWEREGRPDGREQEHWDRAERELRAEGSLGGASHAAPDEAPGSDASSASDLARNGATPGASPAAPTETPTSDTSPDTELARNGTIPGANPAAGQGRTGKGGRSTGSAARERTRRRTVGPDA